MPVYEFRCEASHVHDAVLPIRSTARSRECPECGAEAKRLISAPGLSRASTSSAGRLIERTEATAHEPAVVSAIPSAPSRRPRPVSRDPRHARLPRP